MAEVSDSIRCPKCGRESSHPEDIKQRYCGNCHELHEDMVFVGTVTSVYDDGIEIMQDNGVEVYFDMMFRIDPVVRIVIGSHKAMHIHEQREKQTMEQGLDFGRALEKLKDGELVTRAGWNGKGMFLYLVQASTFQVNRPPLLGIFPEGKEINYQAHIDMKTANGSCVPWLASQSDILANDWMVTTA